MRAAILITLAVGGLPRGASAAPHRAPAPVLTDATDSDADGIPDQLETYLIAQFAPEVRLAPDAIDWTRPANVEWYLPRVRMRFDHAHCRDHELRDAGTLTPDNVALQSHARTGWLCGHRGAPLQSGADPQFTAHKQFFLQATNDRLVHPGIPPSRMREWKVYAHVEPSSYVDPRDHVAAAYDVQIWMFYAYDDARGPFNHEGDWEHVTISVGADLGFVSAYFATHNTGERWRASELTWRDATHVIAYSADGSHATYPSPGRKHGRIINDHCYDHGPTWETWRSVANLGERGHVAREVPWARYSGRWGEIGHFEFTSGPVGPMYQRRWHARGSEY